MPVKKFTYTVKAEQRGLRLDQLLTQWLPQVLNEPLSKGKVRKLILAGAVYLNGKRNRIASKPVFPGARIDTFVDFEKLSSTVQDIPFTMTQDRILFEDPYILVVDKPPGLPTQPTVDEARVNLYQSVRKFLSERDKVPVTKTYLGLHHRLDRDTSGAILFTKAQEANPGIAEVFAKHQVVKIYQALTVRGELQPKVRNYLGKLKIATKKAKFGSVRSGGDLAETEFRLIQDLKTALWIEALPKTGRTHQIRIHLSEQGIPILGDTLYGGPSEIVGVNIPRVMLHAASLTFPHPIHNNRISVQCLVPGDIKQCLEALQRGSPES